MIAAGSCPTRQDDSFIKKFVVDDSSFLSFPKNSLNIALNSDANTEAIALPAYGYQSGLKVRLEIRFPIRAQSHFPFSIPFDSLYVLGSPAEMQNFSESSVNFEVFRAGGLN
jgi:hypothetical protein